jgi:hypothetical protein
MFDHLVIDESPASGDESVPDLRGEPYLDVLARLHRMLRPKTYLEVGSRTGDSLALADCASVAIDPDFNLTPDFFGTKSRCALYRMTSDEFFAAIDPPTVLGGPIDLAFLDGMHLAEFLLRDFMNTERHCKRNSVIAMHDCVPVEIQVARRVEHDLVAAARSMHPNWWTGDVWKVIVMLKKYRPALRIHAIDAHPTGLILVTGLDPASSDLSDGYFDIVDEMRTLSLESVGVGGYHAMLQPMSTGALARFEDVAQLFWL